MDIKTAIDCINYLLIYKHTRNQRLTSVEEIIIRGCWEGKLYKEIAREYQSIQQESYIGNCARKLWIDLSQSLGESVKKVNWKSVIRNWYETEGKELIHPHINSAPFTNYFANLLKDKDYIAREEEKKCYNALLRPKACLRLKGLTQVGKTRLIQRVVAYLNQKKQYNYTYLSLKEFDASSLDNTDSLMGWFAQRVTNQLNYSYSVEDCFPTEEIGAVSRCTTYFEEYILANLETPLVLCIDDVHLLLPHEKLRDSFFRMLRSWLEKEHPAWKYIFRLAIIYTTDIYTSQSINRSPLNIGVVVEISDFSNQELDQLVKTYKTIKPHQINNKGVNKLKELVSNNPYLVKIALDYLTIEPEKTLTDILSTATTDVGIYKDNLRDLWLKLAQNSTLENLFKEVIIKGRVSLYPKDSHFLQRMGLIKIVSEGVEPRCELYSQYFGQYWKQK